jgi:hypothetical protein
LDGDNVQFFCQHQANTVSSASFAKQSEFQFAQQGSLQAYWDSHNALGSPLKFSQRYSSVVGDVLHVSC